MPLYVWFSLYPVSTNYVWHPQFYCRHTNSVKGFCITSSNFPFSTPPLTSEAKYTKNFISPIWFILLKRKERGFQFLIASREPSIVLGKLSSYIHLFTGKCFMFLRWSFNTLSVSIFQDMKLFTLNFMCIQNSSSSDQPQKGLIRFKFIKFIFLKFLACYKSLDFAWTAWTVLWLIIIVWDILCDPRGANSNQTYSFPTLTGGRKRKTNVWIFDVLVVSLPAWNGDIFIALCNTKLTYSKASEWCEKFMHHLMYTETDLMTKMISYHELLSSGICLVYIPHHSKLFSF